MLYEISITSLNQRQAIYERLVQGGDAAHHCAIGVGNMGDKLEKLGALLNVEVNQVC
jgi:L-arabinose isomerase